MLKIDFILAYELIRGEEIFVVDLQGVLVVLSRVLKLVDEPVLEVRLSVLASEMSICLLNLLFGVEETPTEGVNCTFDVHHRNIFAIQDTESKLKVNRRLWSDVPLRDWRHSLLRVDFYPHL